MGNTMRIRLALTVSVLFVFLFCAGCQTTYYAVWEKLGKEKRHLLKDQVEKAQSEQQDASEQFKDALTRIKELYGFEGGDLEKFYNKLKSDYEESERRAEAVRSRIEKVEQVAEDLFTEWELEIDEISNKQFRMNSRASLRDTKQRYARLRSAMTKAEGSMVPVLTRLKDYVLYLKHNLNAQAIGFLRREVGNIEVEVQGLIQDITQSVAEADNFLKALES
jgi:gas vesicle protein